MAPLIWFAIAAAVGAVLVFGFINRFAVDRLDSLATRLHGAARVISRGQLIEAGRRREVALALTDTSFIYEGANGQTSFDRQWLHEVEYEHRLLRVTSFTRVIEFVLSPEVAREWESILPAHH